MLIDRKRMFLFFTLIPLTFQVRIKGETSYWV